MVLQYGITRDDYYNLNGDMDNPVLNDLLMSKMFLKYTEMGIPSLPRHEKERTMIKTYKRFKFEYGIENYCKV